MLRYYSGQSNFSPQVEKLYKNIAFRMFCNHCATRNTMGNWGNISPEDKAKNEKALTEGQGEEIWASYPIPKLLRDALDIDEDHLWIITIPNVETYTTFPSEN